MPESRVLDQLVEALLFEGLVPWSARSQRASGDGPLTFAVGSRVYGCRAAVGAFGRVRLTRGSLRRADGSSLGSAGWQEILEGLPAEPRVRDEIGEELASTERLCRWNLEHAPAPSSRRGQSYEELEGSLHEGHPYHPCFKARTGFSVDDHGRYGPEAGETFGVRWLAVARGRLSQTLPGEEARFWLDELGESLCRELERAREQADAPFERYGILPVHPWQWQRLEQRDAVRAALAQRELVDLSVTAGAYRATQSVRTLLTPAEPRRAHLKLSLGVRISSSLRLLAPEAVSVAPALSAWLGELVESDPFFSSGGLVILSEYAGASYVPLQARSELDGQLGFILRESVGRHLRRGESAVPFNALFAGERDGRPFIDPWLARHGLGPWLERLLNVVVLPVFRLLVQHGVAVEAHAQNMVLVHRDGWPERLALRDFHDSLEYVPSYLADPSRAPCFAALDERYVGAPLDRYHAMSSVEELRELFMDATFVFNLSELSHLLARNYAFPEADFWGWVRRALEAYVRSAWGDERRARLLGYGAPRVRVESLFENRLVPDAPAHHHSVPNALHGARERIDHARYR